MYHRRRSAWLAVVTHVQVPAIAYHIRAAALSVLYGVDQSRLRCHAVRLTISAVSDIFWCFSSDSAVVNAHHGGVIHIDEKKYMFCNHVIKASTTLA